MAHQILEALRSTRDSSKKAAIIAEFIFSTADDDIAQVARQCVILHWFDLPIVEAFLSTRTSSRIDAQQVYSQLALFPFIERLPWGLKYHRLTREGLLHQYVPLQQNLMMHAARVAMDVYRREETEGEWLSEAFYCAMISGDTNISQALLQRCLEQAICRENWLIAGNLFLLQEEAENLPFVQPLPYTEHLGMLRALVHRMRGEYQAALTNYDHVIALHPTSVLAYSSRGTVYAECHQYQESLADYEQALILDPANVQLKMSRSIILAKQSRLLEIQQQVVASLHLDPTRSLVYCEQQKILDALLSLLPQKKPVMSSSENRLQEYEHILKTFKHLLQPEMKTGENTENLGEGRRIMYLSEYFAIMNALEIAFCATHNQSLREMLITIYMPLVRLVIGRMCIPPTSLLEVSDLFSYGKIGLINAIDCFDPTIREPFETFATYHIRRTVFDHLRSLNWLPRVTILHVHQVEAVLANVQQRMGRPAKENEVASELGLSIERYRQVLLDASIIVYSLSVPRSSFQDDEIESLKNILDVDTLEFAVDGACQGQILALSHILDQLPEREQLLLSLYHQEELTLKEISTVLTISELRVCQLFTQACLRILATQTISSNKGETAAPTNNREQEEKWDQRDTHWKYIETVDPEQEKEGARELGLPELAGHYRAAVIHRQVFLKKRKVFQRETFHLSSRISTFNRALWRKWSRFTVSGLIFMIVGIGVIIIGALLNTIAYFAEGLLIGLGAIIVFIGMVRLLIGFISPSTLEDLIPLEQQDEEQMERAHTED